LRLLRDAGFREFVLIDALPKLLGFIVKAGPLFVRAGVTRSAGIDDQDRVVPTAHGFFGQSCCLCRRKSFMSIRAARFANLYRQALQRSKSLGLAGA
jgi:hypothetical protein